MDMSMEYLWRFISLSRFPMLALELRAADLQCAKGKFGKGRMKD